MTDNPTPLADLLHLERMVTDATEELERTIRVLSIVTQSQVGILKAFGDLYLELTEETRRRKFLETTIRMAEREAARLKIPIWFWRPEKGLSTDQQVELRARWLLEEKHGVDDTWDLLVEYQRDWAKVDVDEVMLIEAIKRGADASAF